LAACVRSGSSSRTPRSTKSWKTRRRAGNPLPPAPNGSLLPLGDR
jgi:hypothetical protein